MRVRKHTSKVKHDGFQEIRIFNTINYAKLHPKSIPSFQFTNDDDTGFSKEISLNIISFRFLVIMKCPEILDWILG